MDKKNIGVWATFAFLDETCAAIKALKKEGIVKITTHSPCARDEITDALGNPQSGVATAAAGGAVIGLGLAVFVIIKSFLDWILPVSGKPIISYPVIVPVAFELSVLMSIFFSIAAMVILIIRDTRRHSLPKSPEYKSYNRFLRDRFGIVVSCDPDKFDSIVAILKDHNAEEVNLET